MDTADHQPATPASPTGRSTSKTFVGLAVLMLASVGIFMTLIVSTAWALGLIASELSVDTRYLMATIIYSTLLVVLAILFHGFYTLVFPRAIAEDTKSDKSEFDEEENDDDQLELDRPAWVALERLGFMSRRDYEISAILDEELSHTADSNRTRKVNRNRRQRRKSR